MRQIAAALALALFVPVLSANCSPPQRTDPPRTEQRSAQPPRTEQQNKQLQQEILNIYIEPLPDGLERDYYLYAVREAYIAWEKANPNLAFREQGDSRNADVHVDWIKDFGKDTLGHTFVNRFVEIGLGDSKCGDDHRFYTAATVMNVAVHEFGHVRKIAHSDDPKNIMYPRLRIRYEPISDAFTLPAMQQRAYRLCSSDASPTFPIDIQSSEYVNIYIFPDEQNYKLFMAGKRAVRHPVCEATSVRSYKNACRVRPNSFLVIENPSSIFNSSLKVNILEE